MNNSQTHMEHYLKYCQNQKRLDAKTLKAYRIDLSQFCTYLGSANLLKISTEMLESFIATLHQKYKPKTVKRKIASLKAIFHYFEYKEPIERNPFHKIQVKFREPVLLPKTIPLHAMEKILSAIYKQFKSGEREPIRTEQYTDNTATIQQTVSFRESHPYMNLQTVPAYELSSQ